MCSPASPGKDTAIFSEICGIILTTPCPHATQPVPLLPYWDVSAIFVLPSPSDACAPLPAGEDRRRAPTRFVREARGATRVARASAEPACRRPSLASGTAAGAQRAQIRPPRVKEGGSDTAKRCFRGPHELAFIPSNIFIYPQFASRVKSEARGAGVPAGDLFKPHSQTSAALQSQ